MFEHLVRTSTGLQVKVITLLDSFAIALAYFLGGLSSSFLFWLGLLFEYPLYPAKTTLVSASLISVLVGWMAHKKFGGKPSMAYSTPAFIVGGTVSAVGVWFLFLLLLFWASVVVYGYPEPPPTLLSAAASQHVPIGTWFG